MIAAAGKSSRMGAFKPLLKIGSVSAAQRVVLNFRASGIETIVIVTGNNAEQLENHMKHLGVIFLRNELYETTAMFDSVKIGLDYLKDICDRILFTPADIPLFLPSTVKKLLKCEANVGIPVFRGNSGHPVIFDRMAVDMILRYTGDDGLRGAVKNLSFTVERIETDDMGMLYDMDTQADYAAITKLL